MTDVLQLVIQSADMVVLEQDQQSGFSMISPATRWLAEIWKDRQVENRIDLSDVSPFLDNFLIDANEHWHRGTVDSLKSGPFLEGSDSGSYALEATASVVKGKHVLILNHLGVDYETQLQVMQAARENLLTQEMLEVEVSRRTQEIRERESEIAGRLIYAAGFRDEETGAHIKRIGLYSAAMGKALGWNLRKVEDIRIAAPMHDLGKIGIADDILKKPGRLNDAEWTIMKTHPSIGESILSDSEIPMIQMAADIAVAHHEQWDGNGYPSGLVGEEIPITARIVSIVDVYDALVHKRVYKPAITEKIAISMMAELVGRQFDPALFELFTANLDVMREIREYVVD